MDRILRPAAALVVVTLVACHGGAPTAAPPTVRMASSVDELSMQRGEAAYQALVAAGMVYHISGRVDNISVTVLNGKTHVSAVASPGEYVQVSLVKGSHDTVDFDRIGQRGERSLPAACADCEDGGSNLATPAPRPTPPPNYDACRNAGGATWFDEATGAGGCLGPGASKGFPCGIWAYSSPGRGRYRDWGGTTDYAGFAWMSSNSVTGFCSLGPLP